jgi:hypothetical protein
MYAGTATVLDALALGAKAPLVATAAVILVVVTTDGAVVAVSIPRDI